MFDKSTLIMFSIGGGITMLAFGFSLLSVTKINLPPEYKKRSFKGKIETVNDIEDLEFSNGCKFYFYEPTLIESDGIKEAREFKVKDTEKGKMFNSVKEHIKNCTEGRLIYLSQK